MPTEVTERCCCGAEIRVYSTRVNPHQVLEELEDFRERHEQCLNKVQHSESGKDSDDLRQPSPLKTVDSFTSDSVTGKVKCPECGNGNYFGRCPVCQFETTKVTNTDGNSPER